MKILLNISIYIIAPMPIPTNINPLKCPFVNLKIEYKIINAVIIQKRISSIYVIKSVVLKDFLSILKKSNKIEIKKPFNIKIINKYTWFSKLSPYLNILPKRDAPFLSISLSE